MRQALPIFAAPHEPLGELQHANPCYHPAVAAVDDAPSVASGEIAIYFDDMKNPVMTATDKTFSSGQIGVGTFDDISDWDDIELRGTKAQKIPDGK